MATSTMPSGPSLVRALGAIDTLDVREPRGSPAVTAMKKSALARSWPASSSNPAPSPLLISEEDALEAMFELAAAAEKEDRQLKSKGGKRSQTTTSSDDDNNGTMTTQFQRINLGLGLDLLTPSANNKGPTFTDPAEGLLILASCIPPGPDIDMTDEDRLAKLAEYLESVGEARDRITDWKIVWSKGRSGVPYFQTQTGAKLRNKAEVAEFLNLPAMSMKMAEMVDYMDERHLAFTPSEWRVEERRKIDGRRTGFSFVSRLTGKTFYARNRIAEYLETYKSQPLRRVKKRNRANRPDGEGSESESTDSESKQKNRKSQGDKGETNRPLSKKRKKMWRPGDAVVVDYEGTVYDAVIVPAPPDLPDLDSEEDERLVSVFYIQEECFEHGVLESRILRERPSTKTDQNVLKAIEKNGGSLALSMDVNRKKGRLGEITGSKLSSKATRLADEAKMKFKATMKAKEEERSKKAESNAKREKAAPTSVTMEKVVTRPAATKENGSTRSATTSPDEDVNGSAGGEDEKKTHTSEEEASKSANRDAQAFMALVRGRIEATMPRLFLSFISMMTEYHRGRIRLSDLIDFMVDAFGEDDTDIVLKFNVFLPPEAQITPAYIRRRLAHLTRGRGDEPVNEPPHSPAYEAFLQMVMDRFRDKPSIVQRFKSAVARYQSTADIAELAHEGGTLFTGNPDIIQAFNVFLPDGYKVIERLNLVLDLTK